MTDGAIINRLLKEHNKLVKLRDEFGLQNQGHGELHLAHYCLTGNLVSTDHCKVLTWSDING